MNERIEQLAEQCWVHTNEPLFAAKSPHWEFDRHKFAELIVKETITEMCQQLYWHGEDQSNNPAFYKAIDKTKKQFGVAE